MSVLNALLYLVISLFYICCVTAQSAPAADGSGTTNAPPHWGYDQVFVDELPPREWEDAFPACAGARQSPIALNLLGGIDVQPAVMDPTLQPLDFSSYLRNPRAHSWNVVNNGHSVQLTGNFTHPPILRQGSLGANYQLLQFHFHWGATDARGSEHVIDGRRYPLELHLVHRKTDDTDEQASRDSTGMAVVAVLFDIAADDELPNPHMDALATAVQQAAVPGVPVAVTLPELNLSELIPSSQAYFRYLGSLTTPPCSEAVVWTVMMQHQKVTEAQLQIFRSLHQTAYPSSSVQSLPVASEDLVDNFRPTQSANGRLVSYHPEWSAFTK